MLAIPKDRDDRRPFETWNCPLVIASIPFVFKCVKVLSAVDKTFAVNFLMREETRILDLQTATSLVFSLLRDLISNGLLCPGISGSTLLQWLGGVLFFVQELVFEAWLDFGNAIITS